MNWTAKKGEDVNMFVHRMMARLSEDGLTQCSCRFNDIRLEISHDSHVGDILTVYDLKCQVVRLNKEVNRVSSNNGCTDWGAK